jgi:hypothetical protein
MCVSLELIGGYLPGVFRVLVEPGIHRDSGDRRGREPLVSLLEAGPDIRVAGQAGTASECALEGCGRQPGCGTQQRFMLHAGRRDPVVSP